MKHSPRFKFIMKRRSYTSSAWYKAGMVGSDGAVIVDEEVEGDVGKEMGLGFGSVGSVTVVG